MHRRSKPLVLAILLSISLALLGLRMAEFALSGAGLHVDEAQYWVWSNDLQWGYFSKPPVLVALIKASTTLLGHSLLAVKASAMVCWILSSWILGCLAYRMYGLQSAIVAGFLFASTPISGLLGLSVTTDGPLTLFWALSMLTLWKAAHAQNKSAILWWIACGLSLGLAILSKYSALALGLSALWLLWAAPADQRGPILRGGIVTSFVALLVLAPHLAWNVANHWPTAHHTMDITLHESGSTVAGGAGGWRRLIASGMEFFLGQLLILGPAIWLIAAKLWRMPKVQPITHTENAHWTVHTYAAAFSVPILLLGIAQALNSKALINWSVPMALGVCLWLACVLSKRVSWLHWILACLSGLVLSGAIALGGDLKQWVGIQTQPGQSKWDIWGRMRGWHEALHTLQPQLEPYVELPWVTDERSTLVQASYELRSLSPKFYAWNADGSVHHHFEWKQPWTGQGNALIWISSQPPHTKLVNQYAEVQPLANAQSDRVTLQAWLLKNPRQP